MNKKAKQDVRKIRKIFRMPLILKRNRLGEDNPAEKRIVGTLYSKIAGKDAKRSVEDLTVTQELSVRYDCGDLMVITATKKLCTYIITITEKSPKKFRFSFISRLHNTSIDALELLLKANIVSKKTNAEQRKNLQLDAYAKLKLVTYFALLACENNCILKKQYAQISLLASDCINLLFAWRKSDEK